MNKLVADLKPESEVTDPLALLRAPFPPNQISKLPKPQLKREEMDKLPKAKCAECGGYHATSKIIHLDYVGHAALTDRLLDVDPHWTWEPVPNPAGLGLPTSPGGMWIKLTVCDVSRYGFGHAEGKTGGDAIKETIGDALRNAGMRFGMALDLWHKGDLHAHQEPEGEPTASAEELAINHLRSCALDKAMFAECWAKNKSNWKDVLADEAYARVVAEMKRLGAKLAAEEAPAKTPHEIAVEALADDTIPF